jgi:hypothetical protein
MFRAIALTLRALRELEGQPNQLPGRSIAVSEIMLLSCNKMFLLRTTSLKIPGIPGILNLGSRIAQCWRAIYASRWLQTRSGVENEDIPRSRTVTPRLSVEGIRASAVASV